MYQFLEVGAEEIQWSSLFDDIPRLHLSFCYPSFLSFISLFMSRNPIVNNWIVLQRNYGASTAFSNYEFPDCKTLKDYNPHYHHEEAEAFRLAQKSC